MDPSTSEVGESEPAEFFPLKNGKGDVGRETMCICLVFVGGEWWDGGVVQEF